MRTIISNLRTARMAMMFILALLTTLTVQAAADKTALTTAVSEAETYHSSIQESNPNEAEVLTMIINACKTVLNDADAVQSDVDFAATFMNETVKQCKIAVAQPPPSARPRNIWPASRRNTPSRPPRWLPPLTTARP